MDHDMVRIKGTRNGLVIVLDPSREFEEIKNNLLRKMESAKGFFKGAKFSLFQSQKDIPAHQQIELESICRQFGLVPNTEEPAALRSDLAVAPRTSPHADQGEAALMVRRSLRSGQKITCPSHVIVIGDVHPGAEVVSGGNILITGNCYGLVHAGAGGNRKARVIAQQLAPTVISIADRRYAPEGLGGHTPLRRQMALLTGQKIVFEQL
ncbi:MAG: putative septum site-determining protein MinC [Pelotomaculum sp. PtaU1.Bin035]|nr:MAG: putative septum site-determining protein MinC [Pelotomaculum sp. PtaU1.Bin035]